PRERAHRAEQAGAAGAPLEHGVPAPVVLGHEPLGERPRERLEPRREGLRLLGGARVVLERRVKRRVEDEPAGRAEREREVAAWKVERLLAGREQRDALHGDAALLVERLGAADAAGRAVRQGPAAGSARGSARPHRGTPAAWP